MNPNNHLHDGASPRKAPLPSSSRPGTPAEVVRTVVSRLLDGYEGKVAVRLWDGTFAHGRSDSPCILLINEPEVVRELVLHPDLFRLVEAYLAGRLDLEGDFETLFELGDHLERQKLSPFANLDLARLALQLPRPRQTREEHGHRWSPLKGHRNSRDSIAHHYDLGNDFYRLWLDPEMVYSCAYFASETQPLAEAQRDKLDYLCRKLRLQPGHHLLDIGCGWGALAVWAAKHYGAQVHGITLSEEQYRYATERVRREGLEERVTIELRDYRDLPVEPRYDRVVSVGMFEHIGLRNFPRYFGTIQQLLRPDGLFLNHGITSDSDWKPTVATRFINRYIFPDGELARVDTVIKAMEDAGFETLDVESLRPHYAMTLRHWVRNLEAAKEEAVAATSEATWRLWRLYMAGCAFNFQRGGIGLHQILAGHRGAQAVPLRRDDLYRTA